MPSVSLHSHIEFSTGRAILKSGWSTCPLRCGLVLLMAVIKVILGNSSSHPANAFSVAVRYRLILIDKWSTTGHRLDHYWSPPGSLLITGWITTDHRLDHYWWEAVTYTAWRIDHYWFCSFFLPLSTAYTLL